MKNKIGDHYGRIPLHYAEWFEMLEIMNEHPEWIDVQDRDGLTPLHFGVIQGDCVKIEKLLAQGAKWEIEDSHGNRALNRVVYTTKNHEKIVDLFLSFGDTPSHVNLHGSSPYYLAESCGDEGVLKKYEKLLSPELQAMLRDLEIALLNRDKINSWMFDHS